MRKRFVQFILSITMILGTCFPAEYIFAESLISSEEDIAALSDAHDVLDSVTENEIEAFQDEIQIPEEGADEDADEFEETYQEPSETDPSDSNDISGSESYISSEESIDSFYENEEENVEVIDEDDGFFGNAEHLEAFPRDPISAVYFDNITEPVGGAAPVYSGIHNYEPSQYHFVNLSSQKDMYYEQGVCWYDVTNNKSMQPGDTYIVGNTYRLYLLLEASPTFAFPDKASGTLPGRFNDNYDLHYAKSDLNPLWFNFYTDFICKKKVTLKTPILHPCPNEPALSWDPVDGVVYYRVFRKTNDGDWKKLADTFETDFYDGSAVSGNKYTYTVRCVAADQKTYQSSYDKTGISVYYIAKPAITYAYPSSKGIDLTWSASKGAAKYRLYYHTSTSTKWTKIVDTTSTKYTVPASKLKKGTTYYFTLRCLNRSGDFCSGYDKTGRKVVYKVYKTLPDKVTLDYVANNMGKVYVEWLPAANATAYRVYRKAPGGSYKFIGTSDDNVYEDTTVVPGKTYTYTVRGLNWAGLSSTYDKTGKTVTFWLDEPAINSVSYITGGVSIKWPKVSRAAKYRVFYKADGDTGWTRYKDTTSTSITIKDLKPGKDYLLTVRCITADGKSYTSKYDKKGCGITFRTKI